MTAAVLQLAAVSCLFGQAPGLTGIVEGTMRETGWHSRPLSGAVVLVDTTAPNVRKFVASVSDSGAFRATKLPLGRIRLAGLSIGYYPETLEVNVVAGVAAKANFELRQMVWTEAPVIVSIADPLTGKMGPFNKRKSRGVGTFITREQIDERKPPTMSELLRYVPGVGVTQKMAGEPQPVHMQRSMSTSATGSCEVLLYVDGHPYPNGSVDDFRPTAIEGVEVYRSASEIPADFRTRDATCGVIALWTRDPDAASKRAP